MVTDAQISQTIIETSMSIIESNLKTYVDSFSDVSHHLDDLCSVVSDDIEFKDPFNHVYDKNKFIKVMQHFVENSEDAHFNVNPYHIEMNENGAQTILHWTFTAKIKIIGQWRFEGMSLVHINKAGLINRHIDFWDSGEHFYKHIPVVGLLIKKIIKRVKIHE